MKILIEMGLSDTLVDCLVRPITHLERVQKVLLVRYRPGLNLPKTRYYCPPLSISRFLPLASVYKFFILIYLSLVERPDFIHSFRLFPHGIMAFVTAKLTRRPVGVTLNAGQVELYRLAGSPLGVDLAQSLPMVGKLYLWMLNQCNSILVINSTTRNFLVNHDVSKHKVFILPQPVDIDKHRPMSTPKKYDVISIGRLVPEKHVEVAIKAIASAKLTYPNIKLAIIGDGPSRSSLEKFVSDAGLSENVEFLGFRDDTEYYYNSSRIFVLTSEREGGPLTFTEAMACGIPPIVSNVGIVPDVGRDGSNCIIIKRFDDHIAYAEAIVRLLKNEGLYRRLSQNALETARGITQESAVEVWDKILSRHAR